LTRFIDLRLVLAISSVVSIAIQMAIINLTVSKNKDIALIWVVFNPLSLIGGGIQNVGVINDALFYAIIYFGLVG